MSGGPSGVGGGERGVHHAAAMLQPFLIGLMSRHQDKRLDTRRKLIAAVMARAEDRGPAAFTALLKDLYAVGRSMMDQPDPRDVTSGLYVLGALADVADDSRVERRLRFLFDMLHYMEGEKAVLHDSVIRVAGECVGHLAQEASTTEMEFLREQYMPTCLTWLRDKRSEPRRQASLVLLHQIAVHTPTIFYDERRTFFDDVKSAFFDSKQALREAATEALGAFLTLAYEREGTDTYYREALKEATQAMGAKAGFMDSLTSSSSAVAAVHGALLVISTLLQTYKNPKQFFRDEEFEQLCEQVLSKITHASRAVRHTVLALIPKLAMVDVTAFWYHFSGRITQHLLSCMIKKGAEDQAPAYQSLGQLALVMGPSIFVTASSSRSPPSSPTPTLTLPHIYTQPAHTTHSPSFGTLTISPAAFKKPNEFTFQLVVRAVEEGLCWPSSSQAFNQAMTCLAMIMRVSADIRENSNALSGMLTSMLRRGVSKTLVETFEVLVTRVTAECRRQVQDLLLAEITSVLAQYCQHQQPNIATPTTLQPASAIAPAHRDGLTACSTPSSSPTHRSSLNLSRSPSGVTSSSFMPLSVPILSSSISAPGPMCASPVASGGVSSALTHAHTIVSGGIASSMASSATSSATAWPSMNKFFATAKDEEKPTQMDLDTVLLSLQTLASFDFYSGGNEDNSYAAVAKLCRQLLVRLLHDQDAYIRQAAGVTVVTLLTKVAKSGKAAHTHHVLIKQSLNRLLTAGLSDSSVDIRVCIFENISPPLDAFLASPVNVDIIFAATRDENFQVRVCAVKCIGRLTRQDTSRMLPMLRKIWVTLMECVSLGSPKATQESLLLVQSLLQVEPTLVRPYVRAFVRHIFSTFERMDSEAVTAAVSVVGELAMINPDDVRPYVDMLMPRLIDSLRGSSTLVLAKKEAAMRALGQLCGSTGLVFHAYHQFPDLFPALFDILQRTDEASLGLRHEAIRALGILGALSPGLYNESTARLQHRFSRGESGAGEGGAAGPKDAVMVFDHLLDDNGGNGGGEGNIGHSQPLQLQPLLPLDELYPAVATTALLRILRDPQATSQYPTALQTLMLVMKRMWVSGPSMTSHSSSVASVIGQKSSSTANQHTPWRAPIARALIMGLAEAISRQDLSKEFRMALLDQFAALIELVGPIIRDYTDLVFKVMRGNWDECLGHCLQLVLKMWHTLPATDFRIFLSDTLPLVLNTIHAERGHASQPQTLEVLNCLGRFRHTLPQHFNQILPELLQLTRETTCPKPVQRTALALLVQSVADDLSALSDHANTIVHCLLNLLSGADVEMHKLAMNALLLVVCKLRLQFIPYVLSVRKVIVAYCRSFPPFETYLSTYDAILLKILKGRPFPGDQVSMDNPWAHFPDKATLILRGRTAADKLTINRQALDAVCSSSVYATSSDWSEWMRRLSVELTRQSPSAIIRPCSALAQVHPSMAMAMFDVSFLSVWNDLYPPGTSAICELQALPLVDALETALRSPSLPIEVLNKLLNLVEFMELRDRPLPIDIRLLGAQSERAQAYAKCLKYREMEFQSDASPDCVEALISVYDRLGLRDAAMGILRQSERFQSEHGHLAVRPSWLEKIHQWEKALSLYDAYTDSVEDKGEWDGSSSPRDRRASSHVTITRYSITTSASGRHLTVGTASPLCSSPCPDSPNVDSGGCNTPTVPLSPAALRRFAHVTSPTAVALVGDLDVLEAKVGKLRCLEALGDYPVLLDEAKSMKQRLSKADVRQRPRWRDWVTQVLVLGTKASFILARWPDMADFINTRRRILPNENVLLEEDTMLYEAMLKIERNEFSSAQECINQVRQRLAPVISSLLKESYTRAYRCMVTAQQLTELEEIMQYKRIVLSSGGPHTSVAQQTLRELKGKWDARFTHAAQDMKMLRRVLAVRTLVLRPSDDAKPWIKLANICRKNGNLALCGNLLRLTGAEVPSLDPVDEVMLTEGDSNHNKMSPHVRYALYKFLWSAGQRQRALTHMMDFLKYLNFTASNGGWPSSVVLSDVSIQSAATADMNGWGKVQDLLCKVLVRIGEWQMAVHEDSLERPAMEEVLEYLRRATELCPTSFKAWHAWARVNSSMVDAPMSTHTQTQTHTGVFLHTPATATVIGGAPTNHFPPQPPPTIQSAAVTSDALPLAATSASAFSPLMSQLYAQAMPPPPPPPPPPPSTTSHTQPPPPPHTDSVTSPSIAISVLPMDVIAPPRTPRTRGLTSPPLSPTARWTLSPPPPIVCIDPIRENRRKDASSSEGGSPFPVNHINTEIPPMQEPVLTFKQPEEATVPASPTRLSALPAARQQISVAKYVVQAVRGYLRSIALGQYANQPVAYVLQDTLRVLTLWFKHGRLRSVHQEMEAGLESIDVATWLEVVPQLIARIDSSGGQVSSLLRRLLLKVGRHHPQALIYPITLAANSTSAKRQDAATAILADMRTHSALLVDEAEMVSREMINVAITRQELWHEGLEEASRLYFGEKNVAAAVAVLDDLHKSAAPPGSDSSGLEGSLGGVGGMSTSAAVGLSLSTTNVTTLQGSTSGGVGGLSGTSKAPTETIRTVAFYHCFERDVREAYDWLQAYKISKNEADIHQAWEIYCAVFRAISKHLTSLKSLDLRHVAPSLLQAKNLQLAVPGTYAVDQDVVRIACFNASVLVLASKQRPRRLTIMGSDGKPYMFLLKGHEDLRQDERVMQLFGLINALLLNEQSTSRSNLRITRYAVMPLSSNSGVIGWVKNCDTLHQLIKDYREAQRVKLNVEQKMIMALAPDYEKLPLIHKMEIFTEVLSQTRGRELAKMLWLKSSNSEVWLDRRTNYTRSLAVMSMAGYILGLGDRHPSNLMLDRISGRIVHIDFGDCFEVAMTRTKFPEKVPFRLTRMLISAMEGGGIEGSFRITCENVMAVLRSNRDSLMAMLEAFVHDPLISWRLLATDAALSFADGRPNTELPVDANTTTTTTTTNPATAAAVTSSATANAPSNVNAGGVTGVMGVIPPQQPTAFSSTTNIPAPLNAGGNMAGVNVGGGMWGAVGDGVGSNTMAMASTMVHGMLPVPQALAAADTMTTGAGGVGGAAPVFPIFAASLDDTQTDNAMDKGRQVNKRAMEVVQRIHTKLMGRDFREDGRPLSVQEQVDRLIREATSVENLCQLFMGWCPFW